MGAAILRQSNSFAKIGPKTANLGPKVVFLARYWSSWPIWHHARPIKRNLGGFLYDKVLKLFLQTVVVAILGQKIADFA